MASVHGILRIYDTDYYVEPDDYQVVYEGEPTKQLPSSNGSILDVGYVRQGFTAKLKILDASKIKEIQDKAILSIKTKSPTLVFDTVYPGGKTWHGFFRLPILTNGTLKSNGIFNLPDEVNTSPVTVTFYSATMEMM